MQPNEPLVLACDVFTAEALVAQGRSGTFYPA